MFSQLRFGLFHYLITNTARSHDISFKESNVHMSGFRELTYIDSSNL